MISRSRNRRAISKTSSRRSGSPPENATTRVPRPSRERVKVEISSRVRSSAPVAFHQSQERQRLLQRLVG